MLDTLTSGDFSGLPPGALATEQGGERLALEVLQVRELPAGSPRPQPFALLLAGPASPMLQQGIHPLFHPRHGRLDVFMVPVARDAGRTQYEIIFN